MGARNAELDDKRRVEYMHEGARGVKKIGKFFGHLGKKGFSNLKNVTGMSLDIEGLKPEVITDGLKALFRSFIRNRINFNIRTKKFKEKTKSILVTDFSAHDYMLKSKYIPIVLYKYFMMKLIIRRINQLDIYTRIFISDDKQYYFVVLKPMLG